MTVDMALNKLVEGILEIYGESVERIVLYGSTARGTNTPESDIDIAVMLRSAPTKSMNDQLLDLVVDLELDCGRVLSVIKIDYPRYLEWQDTLPFYRNIDREGVILWQAA